MFDQCHIMCSALQEGEILRLNEAREKYQKQIHDAERKYKEKLSQLEDQLVWFTTFNTNLIKQEWLLGSLCCKTGDECTCIIFNENDQRHKKYIDKFWGQHVPSSGQRKNYKRLYILMINLYQNILNINCLLIYSVERQLVSLV